MSSKKKSKARKGAKKAKEQRGMPDTQMQRLKIDENSQADEDALLEEAIKLAAAEKEALEAATAEKQDTSTRLAQKHHGNGCDHGYDKTEDHRVMVDFANTFMICATGDGCDHGYVTKEDHCIIVDFAKTFTSGFIAAGADADMAVRFEAAEKATWEKYYPEVWEDPSKLKLVVSHFIAIGTRKVCEGNIKNAQFFASLACFFEEFIAACFHQKAMMDGAKMLELTRADEHTLVRYLRKNIPCCCLDGKYKEVKSITKIGICCNPQCHMPDQIVERRTMFTCTQCRDANYCSPECQEAAWPSHKKICDMHVWARAELDSRKQPYWLLTRIN